MDRGRARRLPRLPRRLSGVGLSSAAVASWRAKGNLVDLIRSRVATGLVTRVSPGGSEEGTAFTPLFDLAVHTRPGYGWIPCGIATDSTPEDLRLRRGVRIVYTSGEQEWCPGGPGANILPLWVEPDGSTAPSGEFVIPYDARWDFGENLAEYLLVHPDEPVLTELDRLATLADDNARAIAEAPASPACAR